MVRIPAQWEKSRRLRAEADCNFPATASAANRRKISKFTGPERLFHKKVAQWVD
jgi:hypothetical protein